MCICTFADIRITGYPDIREEKIVSPRRRKGRYCLPFTGGTFYKPQGVPLASLEVIELGQDELEAMRLCDYEGLEQTQAADKMNISRGTIQRLLYSGRKKMLEVILNTKALKIISGEHIVLPPRYFSGRPRRFRRGVFRNSMRRR
jgi:predicted DNA-binding protein (UPF0251 family)